MDSGLAKQIHNGDQKAFRNLFDQYFQTLCSFGYKYIPDISVVEDFVQDVFVKLWENHQEFDDINAIKTFLYTSVRNKCLNHIKHKIVIEKHEKNIITELESESGIKNHVVEEEVFNNLYNEIKNLPESSKKIMLLALNGLKNPEIADELNISVNTVKTQKKIAYSKLKVKLGPLENIILLSLLNF